MTSDLDGSTIRCSVVETRSELEKVTPVENTENMNEMSNEGGSNVSNKLH